MSAIFTSLTPSKSINSSCDASAFQILLWIVHLCAKARTLTLQGAGELYSKGAKQSNVLHRPTSAVQSHRGGRLTQKVHSSDTASPVCRCEPSLGSLLRYGKLHSRNLAAYILLCLSLGCSGAAGTLQCHRRLADIHQLLQRSRI